ncbi:hypothetical protein KIH39_18385 [Telmatocola sphagniphila]|uniref:Uncharacterized protein n=1 Tax=Telmatocola sphagniphila TaxID=1123043 RepID=A0A8E6EX23_9BACT|nr:hypothetical protein [Telmatocola sphagniphila]QVL30806.1 hypothetical protein KIH39_18385 [Telmatocola sphagniphila]
MHSDDLLSLGKPVLDHLEELKIFYLIGCAYQDQRRSLRDIAREFSNRDCQGRLAEGMPTSASKLSVVIAELERQVFGPFFKSEFFSLLEFPQGRGKSAVLSEMGQQAWQLTRQFLNDYYELPEW